ncbi:MAG: hypothetical protein RIT02_1468 [Planctomycetota bacterium]
MFSGAAGRRLQLRRGGLEHPVVVSQSEHFDHQQVVDQPLSNQPNLLRHGVDELGRRIISKKDGLATSGAVERCRWYGESECSAGFRTVFFEKTGACSPGFPYSLVFLTVQIARNPGTDWTIRSRGNLLLVFQRHLRPIVAGSASAGTSVAPWRGWISGLRAEFSGQDWRAHVIGPVVIFFSDVCRD